jgi:lipid II:glycine glycyltransferase (peptidoglycan interpeptide bridge formation enzyme)
VYRFKRGFNGDVVYYAGAHDFAYARPLYGLMHRVMLAKAAPERSQSPVVRPVPA